MPINKNIAHLFAIQRTIDFIENWCKERNHKADAKHSTAIKIIKDNNKLSKPPKNQIRMPINPPQLLI